MIEAMSMPTLLLGADMKKEIATWIWVVFGTSLFLVLAGGVFLVLVSRAKSRRLEGELEPVLDDDGNLVLDDDGEPIFHHVTTMLQPLLDENGDPMLDENGNIIYEHGDDQQEDGVLAAMANFMPWVISALLHVGIFMIMLFFVFMAQQKAKLGEKDKIIIPDSQFSDQPGGSMSDSESMSKSASTAVTKSVKSKSTSDSEEEPVITALSTDGLPSKSTKSLATSLPGGSPGSGFMGLGGNAHNVCYVIDRSGSMLDTFDEVKMEMVLDISRLGHKQKFHIILFAQEKPKEPKFPTYPVKVTPETMVAATQFLDDVIPMGKTDPIPAIRRAYEVLTSRHAELPGWLMYLLTDGLFPDNAAVIKEIKRLSAAAKTVEKDVMINTILYGNKPKEAEDVMRKIADMTSGRYKFQRSEAGSRNR
ncbi:MAG: VWA domain-containing protein [Phycisphaerales bacterium]|jgi:hypothetical protein|nr:VWA domain-containing protein [Phycisphaerales bacterium]MBT7171011.1 VWA domain-containing protein [Phycisphaerales bacterium]